jgi:small-conductance mechanosensitive channel
MLRILLLVLAALLLSPVVRAQTPAPPLNAPAAASAAPAPPALTPAQAQQALEVLRDPAKREQVLTVLEALAKAAPAAPAPAATPSAAPAAAAPAQPAAAAPAPTAGQAAPAASAPAAGQPAPAAAPQAGAAAKLPIPLTPDSLGAEILVGASNRLTRLSNQLVDTVRALTNFPLFTRWIAQVVHDPDARAEIIETSWKLVIVMGVAIAAERLTLRLLRRPLAGLAARAPAGPNGNGDGNDTGSAGVGEAAGGRNGRRYRHAGALLLLRRLPYVLARLMLDLVPLLLLAAIGYGLLGTPLGTPSTTRLVILALLNAYVVTRLVVTLTRVLVAPYMPRLRLVHISDSGATYVVAWVRRLAIIAIFGYAFAEVGLLFGLYRVAHDALLKVVSLIVHLCLVVIVLQVQRPIADLIRAKPEATGPMAVLRNRLATVWHIIAIFYILAQWLVWAFQVRNGLSQLVRIFVATVIVAVLARLVNLSVLGALERAVRFDPELAARYPGLEARMRRYLPAARAVVSGIITCIAFVMLLAAWGIDSFSWFTAGALGGRVVSAAISIGLTILIALVAWEAANAAVQRHLMKLSRDAQAARAARLRTLLPMFRTALLVAICLIAALVVLSEIGVNVAPLLAGAGVVGIAIGFGSQKLVQDVITGLFLLLENAMQVGDVVCLGGLTGTVENLSIRTIRLRALDGSVHIVPFSAVTTVTNTTRDYAYAVLDISVGLNENPDHVTEVVRDVARELRAEPRWASTIRDDLEVLGIEKFIDLAYVLRVRIQTLPGQRGAVTREFNRRIKERFDELAIESPITSHRALGANPPPPPAVPEEAT